MGRNFQTDHLDNEDIHCPQCGYKADGFTSETKRSPKPNDLALCMKCAGINIYRSRGGHLYLEQLPDNEVQQLAKDDPENFSKIMEYAAAIRKVNQKHG
jgi:hypothetical protein